MKPIARRAASWLAAAAGLVLLGSSPVMADCGRAPPPSEIARYRGVTFVATIIDMSRPDAAGPWSITFDVRRVYAGSVPDRLVIKDVGGDCGQVRPERLPRGWPLLVSVNRIYPFDPSTRGSSFGDVLIWTQAGTQDRPRGDVWRFDTAAMVAWDPPPYYPKAAREATTTREILRLMLGRVPDTGSADFSRELPWELVLVFGLVAATALARPLRRQAQGTSAT